ncbi:hypothetical protein EYF80_039286 [Liparis tanakae]|uniref:Uncharacterized protein n=1 Tax=Liparis tanakae TaxID=230148 RepID=A0A4Z2GA62_9TELE|nr:hypothetical protein EYF80_039286 [Liparis tanakae]
MGPGGRPGRWLPGAAAHRSPWSPVESVQREGIPCATPAKLLYCVMHPACGPQKSVTQERAAERGPHANTEKICTLRLLGPKHQEPNAC